MNGYANLTSRLWAESMRIFLSYRRDDAAGQAGRLHDALLSRFGAKSVFHDVSTISPGADFNNEIAAAIDQCEVMLVVIGHEWAAALGPDGRSRLEDPDDYVRLEVASGLVRGKRIIPVTVGGAALPTAASLPEDLRPLLLRQSIELRDASWGVDLEHLLRSLMPEERRSVLNRRRVLAGAGIAASVLALVIARPWPNLPTGESDYIELPSCAPRLHAGTGWTDLKLVGDPSGRSDDSMYVALAGGYRNLEPDQWTLQVRMRKTNQASDVKYHADWSYDGIAVDGLLHPLSCFTPLAGSSPADPGLSSEVLIGIKTAFMPLGQVEVAVRPIRIVIHVPTG
jgi:hypothetical protein